MSEKPARVRALQGAALLAGAVVLAVVLGGGSERFHWTPLVIGLAYLGAAVAGGRDGGHWATACVLCGWGVAAVVVRELEPSLDTAGLYLAGAGAGAAVGIASRRADPLGAAVTVAAAGVILALAPQVGLLTDARTYAVALAAVAAANLGLAAARR